MKVKNKGFTLIELLATVVIIALFMAVAIPSYKNYVLRGAEANAQQLLLQVRSDTERWKAKRLSYRNFDNQYQSKGNKYTVIVRDGADTTKALNHNCPASTPTCINPNAVSWVAFASPVGFKGHKYRINSNGTKCKMSKSELNYDSFTIANDCSTNGAEKW